MTSRGRSLSNTFVPSTQTIATSVIGLWGPRLFRTVDPFQPKDGLCSAPAHLYDPPPPDAHTLVTWQKHLHPRSSLPPTHPCWGELESWFMKNEKAGPGSGKLQSGGKFPHRDIFVSLTRRPEGQCMRPPPPTSGGRRQCHYRLRLTGEISRLLLFLDETAVDSGGFEAAETRAEIIKTFSWLWQPRPAAASSIELISSGYLASAKENMGDKIKVMGEWIPLIF